MNFDERAKSLAELIDQKVAEVYLLDSSVIGIDFLYNGSQLRILVDHATENNVNMHKLRDSLKSATSSLNLLERYHQVGTVPVIMKELEEKQKYLRNYVNCFGVTKGRHESSKRGRLATHHQKKEKRILEETLAVEEKIIRILKERIYAENEEVLKPFEDLVTAAYTDIGFIKPTKNNNDERLVAAAFYLA